MSTDAACSQFPGIRRVTGYGKRQAPGRAQCPHLKEMGYSPDRIDALVWALTELLIEGGSTRAWGKSDWLEGAVLFAGFASVGSRCQFHAFYLANFQ